MGWIGSFGTGVPALTDCQRRLEEQPVPRGQVPQAEPGFQRLAREVTNMGDLTLYYHGRKTY